MELDRLKRIIPRPCKDLVRFLIHLVQGIPVEIAIRRKRPTWPDEKSRFSYQSRYVNFDIKPNERVVDVGSGGQPFPYATVLVERFIEKSRHRDEVFKRSEKPLILADIHTLPFGDKSFDFVYCSHVLEHANDPLEASFEIMRIGKRGFIETPTMGKDALFAWAQDRHKWHVVAIGQSLCFFEYAPRQLMGIQSSFWRDTILGNRWYHQLQDIFYNNQDIFNTFFMWSNKFSVFTFYLDGTVKTLNANVE